MKYLTNTNINSKETSELVHVKTAQFWFGYIKMLHLYCKFTWSIVLGHLYIYCLPQKLITCSPSTIQIAPDHWYKFTFWSSVKHMRMFTMNSLKTVLYQKNWKRFFKTSSWFNIGRNSYCSSYEPKKSEISFLPIQNRHFVRMEVLSEVLAKLDMKTNYVSQKPEPSRIMENITDLEPIFRSIQEYMNRFSKEVNEDVFFNIEKLLNHLSKKFQSFCWMLMKLIKKQT